MPMRKSPIVVSNVSWVLLPGSSGTYQYDILSALGPHTVIVSGNISFDVEAPSDDDWVGQDMLYADIEDIEWVHDKFLQATTMLSWGEIVSPDFDEADHARWGVTQSTTGHRDVIRNGAIVKILRLRFLLHTQGEYNRWSSVGFQTVANGTLVNPNYIYQRANVTQPI